MTFSQWDLVPYIGKRVAIVQRGTFKERTGVLVTVHSNAPLTEVGEASGVAVLRCEGDDSGSGAPFDAIVAIEAIDSIEIR